MGSREHLEEIGVLHITMQDSSAPAKPTTEVKSEKPTSAPAKASSGPFVEKSEAELAKLSKEDRKAYHAARIAASKANAPDAAPKKQLTKADRRAAQDAARKLKEDQKDKSGELEQLVKDLKMQGLNEDQARQLIAEMAKDSGDVSDDSDDDDADPEDLKGCIRQWMDEQQKMPEDPLHDFNLKVRFQGHVDSTPPDHLRSVLELIVERTCESCDVTAAKLQPSAVAAKAEPLMNKWAPLLEPLLSKIRDVLEAADVVVASIFDGVKECAKVPEENHACVAVGVLMAVRDIDMIDDGDLLTGCKRREERSKVLDGFIAFVEAEADDSEGSSDSD